MGKIGTYAFLVAVLIAVIAALVPMETAVSGWVTLVLVILGLIVGLMNVTAKETTAFLVAAIALISATNADLSVIPVVGIYLVAILANIAVIVAPAAIVVALKAIVALARD